MESVHPRDLSHVHTEHMDRLSGAHPHSNGSSSPPKLFDSSQKVLGSSMASVEVAAANLQRKPSPLQRKPVGSSSVIPDPGRPTSIPAASQATPSLQALSPPVRQLHSRIKSEPPHATPTLTTSDYNDPSNPKLQANGPAEYEFQLQEQPEQLQYHHNWDDEMLERPPRLPQAHPASMGSENLDLSCNSRSSIPRDPLNSQDGREGPTSAHISNDLSNPRGRRLTPQGSRSALSVSPASHGRSVSASRSSHSDLLNISYSQQLAQQNHTYDNARLRNAVGSNAALLDARKTLEMYRANIKKTSDPAVSYEFAIFMISAAQEAALATSNANIDLDADSYDSFHGPKAQAELIDEARQILQRLADRTYVFAQYYLADGYASGLFNKGKSDYEKAFPLFISAGKHGHAESGYRAALCYEFGWGCHKNYAKAVKFYRLAASKSHPGAAYRLGSACLSGDLGMAGRFREGIKWLKRATETADHQHNAAPYDLGVMHTTGYGDDVFKDERYAAQLFTQAAELGHAEANLRMGEAYEHGLLTCPKDPALSIHFFTSAAQAGLPKAMMALGAWYMVGAEPTLDKDEVEAYEWIKKAAETNYPKAEYAFGYFTEMGIGCRRDPLEANVWYVRAADHGEVRAKQRLQIIKAAEMGEYSTPMPAKPGKAVTKKKNLGVADKDDKECIVM